MDQYEILLLLVKLMHVLALLYLKYKEMHYQYGVKVNVLGGVKPYRNEQLIAHMFGVILENNSLKMGKFV